MACKRVLLLSFFGWVLCLSSSCGAAAALDPYGDMVKKGSIYVCPYARGTEGIKVLVAQKKKKGRWFRYKVGGLTFGYPDKSHRSISEGDYIIYPDGYPILNYADKIVLVGGGIGKKNYGVKPPKVIERTLFEAAYEEFFEETGVSIVRDGEISKFTLSVGNQVGEGSKFVKLGVSDCYALYINVTKYAGDGEYADDSYAHLESLEATIQSKLSTTYSLTDRPFSPPVKDDELAVVRVFKADDAISELAPDWHRSLVQYLCTL